MKKAALPLLLVVLLLVSSCKKGDFNLFSLQDDITLGQQTRDAILSNPTEYGQVLDPGAHPSQYAYLNSMRDKILASGKVQYATDFPWELYIINDPNTQNAFCTPGGYIFVYTGLIKYLDNASSLAGVLGHEMGHAAHRHSTTHLTKQYGIQLLLDIVLGEKQGLITQVAQSLVSLQFSKSDETDADNSSVTYLCSTQYRANGAQDFFRKIIDSGQSSSFDFLSTHPSPDNRVEKINAKSAELNCNNSPATDVETTQYIAFKNSLP